MTAKRRRVLVESTTFALAIPVLGFVCLLIAAMRPEAMAASVLVTAIFICGLKAGNQLFRMTFAPGILISENVPIVTNEEDHRTGLRIWRTWETRRMAILRSWHKGDVIWEPGEPLTCASNQEFGIHAFKDHERLLEYGGTAFAEAFDTGKAIAGEVALWDNVLEFEHGYRATAAYPMKLYVSNEETASKLRRAYGCEAIVATSDLKETNKVLPSAPDDEQARSKTIP